VPRYSYIKLRVSCLEPRDFAINELRAAVEYLKTIPGADDPKTLIGLIAIARIVPAGTIKLKPQPMLKLSVIRGKTPGQVWEAFDADVDDQIKGLQQHSSVL
jgi:hypothetical protein